MTAATAAIGMLIQNTIGQIVCATRNAPRSGPMIEPIAHTLESQPWMRARSTGVYMSPTTVCASGTSPPAPVPCTTRKTINDTMPPAKPHMSEPNRNSPTAMSSMRLRP